jgi:streptogramin lyase
MHNINSLLSWPLLAGLVVATSSAQVAPGDIAVTGFSTSAFGVISSGPVVTGYATPGFQGTGSATSQAILWDPAHPNDFVIGGFGFVGRATITGPGTVSYALITNSVGTVAQMSWDASGNVVFADAGTDQIRRLDLVSASVTDLSAGAQPWGTNLNAGALDPATGDYIAGGSGAIYRLANGGATATTVVTGLGGFVSGIAFDPLTGEILATVLTANRLLRVDALGNVTDVATPFSIPGPNALDVDQNGDYISGGGTGQVYRVPHGGGAAVLIATNNSPAGAVDGLAVAFGNGYGVPFGQGCNGAGGPVALTASGTFQVGSLLTTTSTNHAPGALGVLVFGLSNTLNGSIPLPFLLDPLLGTSGCNLYCSIDATLIGFAGASSPAPLSFSFTLTPGFAAHRFYVQHASFEPVPGGLAWSNGLAIAVP